MKKIILKLATLMSVLAFVMASCNNEPAFGEHNENQKEKLELLQIAKSMVESQDGTVPLPVNGGGEAYLLDESCFENCEKIVITNIQQ